MKKKRSYTKEEKIIWTLAFLNNVISRQKLYEKLGVSKGTSKGWINQFEQEVFLLNGMLSLLLDNKDD